MIDTTKYEKVHPEDLEIGKTYLLSVPGNPDVRHHVGKLFPATLIRVRGDDCYFFKSGTYEIYDRAGDGLYDSSWSGYWISYRNGYDYSQIDKECLYV